MVTSAIGRAGGNYRDLPGAVGRDNVPVVGSDGRLTVTSAGMGWGVCVTGGAVVTVPGP